MKNRYSASVELKGEDAQDFMKVRRYVDESTHPFLPTVSNANVMRHCVRFTAAYMLVIEEMQKCIQAMNHSTQQTNDTLRKLERLTSGMSPFVNKDN
ncbi:hypothetical protein V4483_15560 [Bacillus paranthracis]|uniref:hypothetical protein n=1 Tax=Bacillus paranthracis TaxID=2026186 RepID=UPI002FCDD92E